VGCREGNPRARVKVFSLSCSRHPTAHVVVRMARMTKTPLGTVEDQKEGLYAEGWRERLLESRKVLAIPIETSSQSEAVQNISEI